MVLSARTTFRRSFRPFRWLSHLALTASIATNGMATAAESPDESASPAAAASNAEAEALKQEVRLLRQQLQLLESRLQKMETHEVHRAVEASGDAARRSVYLPTEVLPADGAGSVAVAPYAAPATPNQDNAEAHEKLVKRIDELTKKLNVTTKSGGSLTLYGFGRGDLIATTHHLNNDQAPFFALSEDASATTGGVPLHEDDSNFNANARLSRIGLDYAGKAEWLCDAPTAAKVEMDFFNLGPAGSESRPVPRLRHGYAQVKLNEWTLLAGQYWDLISPLYPTIQDDTLMWNAGNLGDRRPQFRATWDREVYPDEHLIFASALSLTGALDAQDLDGNTFRDGEDSGVPGLQTRIGYVRPSYLCEKKVEYGVWGMVAWEDVNRPVAGEDQFVARGVGVDWIIPVYHDLVFRGEAWYGNNLSDFRGGIAQGVNLVTGDEIEARGGWAELVYTPVPWHLVSVGGTIDNPVDADISAGGRTLNWTAYMSNRFPLGGGFTIGADVEYWNTEYQGLEKGDAMRFKFWMMQAF